MNLKQGSFIPPDNGIKPHQDLITFYEHYIEGVSEFDMDLLMFSSFLTQLEFQWYPLCRQYPSCCYRQKKRPCPLRNLWNIYWIVDSDVSQNIPPLRSADNTGMHSHRIYEIQIPCFPGFSQWFQLWYTLVSAYVFCCLDYLDRLVRRQIKFPKGICQGPAWPSGRHGYATFGKSYWLV